MKALHMIAWILLIIGGLNWLVFGLSGGWDIGALLGGSMSILSRIVYVLVGLSAIYEICIHKKCCKCCSNGQPAAPKM